MPAGGKVPPDGRPPVAPGVGRTARRHDLEAPATPGLSDSDLQSGDVQRLENSQKVAPRRKRTQPPATGNAPTRRRQGAQRGSREFSMAIPDPVEMAGGKIGGNIPTAADAQQVSVDPAKWMPLMQFIAAAPNSSGPIAKGLVDMYVKHRNNPVVSKMNVIDLNELDRNLGA